MIRQTTSEKQRVFSSSNIVFMLNPTRKMMRRAPIFEIPPENGMREGFGRGGVDGGALCAEDRDGINTVLIETKRWPIRCR